MTALHGGELVVRAFRQYGVRTVFGLTGGHIHPILDVLPDNGIRLIDMRHEAAVVHAADAYARVTGEVGVALVTAGPGVANAVGGLATAFHAGSPVVLLAGSAPLQRVDMGALQEADEVAMVSAVTKWARRVHDIARLPEYLDAAFRNARRGRPGPVLLVLPQDMLYSSSEAPAWQVGAEAEPPAPPASAIAAAFERLRRAQRPLIIAGAGARWSRGASEALRRLAEVSGIPVLGKGLGRGVVPEDERLGYPYEVARTAVPHADVVLLVGARLNFTLNFGQPPRFAPDVSFIQVDIAAEEIGRNHPVDVALVGDAAAAASALADAFEQSGDAPKDRAWLDKALRERFERIAAAGPEQGEAIHPIQLSRAIARRLPKDAIVVGDGANFLNWGRAVIRVHQPGSWLEHAPFGAMGVCTPFGIGARAASEDLAKASGSTPRPVFVVTGDGAFGFYPMELHTAARHNLPFVTVIANDGGWGADRDTQLVRFGRNVGVDFGVARYDEMAKSFGCWGGFVERRSDLESAFDSALGKPVPAVLNVVVDRAAGQERRKEPLLEFQLER